MDATTTVGGSTRAARHAVVVGGSLAGLCAALALSRNGWTVAVLERSSNDADGMGISIDRRLLSSVTGVDAGRLPVIQTMFPATGWALLRSLLAAELRHRPGVVIRRGVRVTGIRQRPGEIDAVVQTDGGDFRADLVVGADGHASTVRRFVAPENPDATFSGVLLWRGLVGESELPNGFRDRDLDFAFRRGRNGDGMLASYGIPGADGDTRSGRRRGAFIWFDASRTAMLREFGRLEGDVVRGGLVGAELADRTVDGLLEEAGHWAPPWRDAIGDVLRRRHFIGTPVAEYLPTRLVSGSVVIVGDAAHAVGPVTGAGFQNGLLDIQALGEVLRGAPDEDIPEALSEYERRRLQPARELVESSQRWSRSFAPELAR